MELAAARFPAVPLERGHYESWYLKAGDAAAREAVWLRYTVHKRPGEPPVGSLWATLFDADGPHAAKTTLPLGALAAGGSLTADADSAAGPAAGSAPAWVRVGEAAIGPRGAHAALPARPRLPADLGRPGRDTPAAPRPDATPPAAPAHAGPHTPNAPQRDKPEPEPGAAPAARWELRFAGADAAPFPYLPRPWMYRAPLPRTKAASLLPAVRVSGMVAVGGRELALDGWPGMVGHNWGAEHAERWIWLHGTGFEQQPEAAVDMVLGRVRVGRWTTPWIANGVLSLDGRRHRLGGLGRARATRVDELPERASFWATGEDVALRGEVGAPPGDVVCWVYSDPAGPQHHVAHCAVADMRLRVARRDLPPVELAVAGGATYELGMREHGHGLPVQPFPDP